MTMPLCRRLQQGTGFMAANFSSTRAAPVGLRQPCSQLCNVRTLMPSSRANFRRAWHFFP